MPAQVGQAWGVQRCSPQRRRGQENRGRGELGKMGRTQKSLTKTSALVIATAPHICLGKKAI